jgi:hypothetical protein
MDTVLITMVATAIYNFVVPFLLEKGKFSAKFPFMQPYAGVLNNVTSFVVALLGAAGITFAVNAQAHQLVVTWPDPEQAAKALLVAGIGYLIQKFAYKRAIKTGA